MPKFAVSRSIEVARPPQEVFDRVVDFKTWTTWSPWLCAEPDAQVNVTENSSQQGAVYSWDGRVVGAGEIEHQVIDNAQSIQQQIRFLRPMKSVSQVTWEFSPTATGTKVTWGMSGGVPFYLFFIKPMIETFVGMDYGRGLSMLKEWIETGHIQSRIVNQGNQSIGPLKMIGLKESCHLDEIGPTMDRVYQEVSAVFQQQDLPQGEGISVYHDFNIKSQVFTFTTGFIVPLDCEAPENLQSWSMDEVNAFRVDHHGSYRHLGNAWSAGNQILRADKIKQSKIGTFEIYKNTPEHTPEHELLTEIYFPLKT